MALDLNLVRGDTASANSVRIPQLAQQKVVGQVANSPRQSPVNISNDLGRSLANLGGAFNSAQAAIEKGNNVDLRIEEFQVQQEREKQSLAAQKSVSESSLGLMSDFDQRQAQAKPGAVDFTKDFSKDIDKHIEGAVKDAPQYYRDQYERSMVSVRQHLLTKSQNFEYSEGLKLELFNAKKGIDDSTKVVYNDPTRLENEYIRWTNEIENNTRFSADAKRNIKDEIRKGFSWSAGAKEIETNPEYWNKILNPYSPRNNKGERNVTGGGFDSVMPFIFNIEKGYNPDDGNGSPVNFGINQGANPDIDVKNLTQEKAATLYKQRYWNRIGGDRLPNDVALMAMDTAVNQGVDFAQKIIKESNGDIDKMAELRRMRYAEIIKNNPKKAEYKNNWESRVESATQAAKQAGQGYSNASDTPTEHEKINQTWFDMADFSEQQRFRNYAESQYGKFQAEQSKQRQEIATSLEIETRNLNELIQRGLPPTTQPKTMIDFQRAYINPERAAQAFATYDNAWKTADETAKFINLPSTALAAIYEESPPPANDPNFAVKSNYQQIRQKSAANIIEQRQKDPWAIAQSTGYFNTGAADPNAQNFADVVRKRSAALPQLMDMYGVENPSVLSGAEVDALSQKMRSLDATGRINLLKTLNQSIADPKAYSTLLNQLRPDSPVTANAGSIAALGGSMRVGDVDVPMDQIARRMVIGEDLLNPRSSDKKTDGTNNKFQMPQESSLRLQWNKAIGNAYAAYPAQESQAYQAYRAYYAGVAAEKGIYKDVIDYDISTAAIKAATGGVASISNGLFSGSYKLVLPYGMPEDVFKDKAKVLWDQTAKANGYSQTDFDDIMLSPTGENGQYLVNGVGGQPALGKNKQPIKLNLLAPISPQKGK